MSFTFCNSVGYIAQASNKRVKKKDEKEVVVRPIQYDSARVDGDDRLFIWDGTIVSINLIALMKRNDGRDSCKHALSWYDELSDIVFRETLMICPHCDRIDYLSQLISNRIHPCGDCRDGHFKQFLKRESTLPDSASWEQKGLERKLLYRSWNSVLSKSSYQSHDSSLEIFRTELIRDLGLRKFDPAKDI